MSSGARHGAHSMQDALSEQTPIDPDLDQIVSRWSDLPDDAKRSIIDIVNHYSLPACQDRSE